MRRCVFVCVSVHVCVAVCLCVAVSACLRVCVGIDSTVFIVDGGQSQRQLTTASVVSVNETTDKSGACDWHRRGADGSGGSGGTTTGSGVVVLTVAAEVAQRIGCDGSGGDLSLGSLCLCLSLRGRCIICASVCLRVCVGARLCRCVSVCRCVCMSACARWCVRGDSTVVIVDGGQSQRQLTTVSVVSVNEKTETSGARGTI